MDRPQLHHGAVSRSSGSLWLLIFCNCGFLETAYYCRVWLRRGLEADHECDKPAFATTMLRYGSILTVASLMWPVVLMGSWSMDGPCMQQGNDVSSPSKDDLVQVPASCEKRLVSWAAIMDVWLVVCHSATWLCSLSYLRLTKRSIQCAVNSHLAQFAKLTGNLLALYWIHCHWPP